MDLTPLPLNWFLPFSFWGLFQYLDISKEIYYPISRTLSFTYALSLSLSLSPTTISYRLSQILYLFLSHTSTIFLSFPSLTLSFLSRLLSLTHTSTLSHSLSFFLSPPLLLSIRHHKVKIWRQIIEANSDYTFSALKKLNPYRWKCSRFKCSKNWK